MKEVKLILILLIIIVYAIDGYVFISNIDNVMNSKGGCFEKMSEEQIKIFNADFEEYKGINKGSVVRTFLMVVTANNATHKHNDDGVIVTVTYENVTIDEPRDLDSMQTKISTTKKYSIELKYMPRFPYCLNMQKIQE